MLVMVFTAAPAFSEKADSSGQDWKKIGDELMGHFKGKIVSIEKLDMRSCWAVLEPGTTDDQAVKLAEEIGNFIKKETKDMKDLKMMVRVFVKNKQVAIAVLAGDKYKGKLMAQPDLDPSQFKGSFKP